MSATVRTCGWCSYDLAGVTGNLCPECGKQIVDYGGRGAVATAIREFLEGKLNGSALTGSWPQHTADTTLHVAREQLLPVLQPFAWQRFGDHCADATRVRALLLRWGVFLMSDGTCEPAPGTASRAYTAMVWAQAVLLLVAISFSRALHSMIGGMLVPLLVRSLTHRRSWPYSGLDPREALASDAHPFRSKAEYEEAARSCAGRLV